MLSQILMGHASWCFYHINKMQNQILVARIFWKLHYWMASACQWLYWFSSLWFNYWSWPTKGTWYVTGFLTTHSKLGQCYHYYEDVASVNQLHDDHNSFYWQDDSAKTEVLQSCTEWIKRILDAKYEKANLDELVCECLYLTEDQQIKLLKLLRTYEYLLDGT